MLCVNKDNRHIKEIADKVPIVQCCEFFKDADIAHVSVDNFAAADRWCVTFTAWAMKK